MTDRQGGGLRATVITDASYCHLTGAAGWAAWIVVDGLAKRLRKSGKFRVTPSSSTEAERWACFNGIWLAYAAGARAILVQTDCLSVVHVARKRGAACDTALLHWPDAQIEWRHVKGHTAGLTPRAWVNNWCDKQAKQVMRMERAHIQEGRTNGKP